MDEQKELLRKRWDSLQAPPADMRRSELKQWKRTRGYALENLMVELARLEKLDARPSYRGKGEQIDGFFRVDHRDFLLEAKWQDSRVTTASDVYAFQGKLRGKLRGTIGLFVSIGRFASKAPIAITSGKEIDVLLADRSDVLLALDSGHTFHEMVRVKMRAAAQLGDVYYTYQRWLDTHQ